MIENTTAADPMLHLLGSMSEGPSGYITGMEAAGQRQIVNSTDLPVKLNGGKDSDFEAVGFTFSEPHSHDKLFRPATLPDGWRREGSDHSMWSYIVDDLGRRRVSIFYKAAFYDREAFMSLGSVYGYVSDAVHDPSASLILDDSWATAKTVNQAIDAILRNNAETLDLYGDRNDDYSRQRVAEVKDLNVRAESLRPVV